MKKKYLLPLVIVLCITVFSFALNRTIEWTSTFSFFIEDIESKMNLNELSLDNQEILDEQAYSLSIPSNILLEDDFEGATSNWTFTTSNTNLEWYIGSAVKVGGLKSLYISDDKGVNNSYSGTTAVIHAISPIITLDATVTKYLFSADWRAKAEGQYDYLSLWLVPEAYNPTTNVLIDETNSGGIEIARIEGKENFESLRSVVDLTKYKSTKIKVVFQWKNDSSVSNPPAGAIDNFEFAKITCDAPNINELKVSNISLTGAQLDWTATTNSATDFDVYIGTNAVLPINPTGIANVKNAKVHTLNNLIPSTYYYVWFRASCSTGDESLWVGPSRFMTLCSALNLPLIESFDTTSQTLGCWTNLDVNNDATSTSRNIWKTFDDNGDGVMFFSGENIQHNDYLLSPTLTLNGGIYKLEFDYKTNTKAEVVDVLLSTSGRSSADFTTILETNETYLSSVYKRKTIVFNGISGEVIFAWRVKSNDISSFYLNDISISEIDCAEASVIRVGQVGSNTATIEWKDNIATAWEYYVQPLGFGLPTGQGTSVVTTEATFTATSNGVGLVPQSEYEFFVRSQCADDSYGQWVGPFVFKTLCQTIQNLPFVENFNTDSTSFDCWSIIDQASDKSTDGLNKIWRRTDNGVYEGDRSIYFSGIASPNNDWLISPMIAMDAAKLYEVSFYYKTNTSKANITILASTNGIQLDQFNVIEARSEYQSANYVKKTVFIEGVGGNVNVAWQLDTSGSSVIYMDQVTIKEVSCRVPDSNVQVTNITENSVTMSWADTTTNTSWEYYVQDIGLGTLPPSGGSGASTKSVTVTRLNTLGNANLAPNTEYEFFVRGVCGVGKQSSWVGPIKFKTACSVIALPFFEGFNQNSSTLGCWTSVANTPNSKHKFEHFAWGSYEGDGHMILDNYNDEKTDYYWISPMFNLVKTKIYEVSYYYRSTTYTGSEHEVLLSKNGPVPAEFKVSFVPLFKYNSTIWQKKIFYIVGEEGNINLAFHTKSDKTMNFQIDAFNITEVACVKPLDLDVENVKQDEMTLSWNDKINTEWEYAILNSSVVTAKPPKGNGTVTNTSKVVAKTDWSGNNLLPNTRYVYYVRSKCSGTESSDWSGPFEVYTACGVQNYPFWEGFNMQSTTKRCWTVLDLNGDGDDYGGKWVLDDYNSYEGDMTMNFSTSGESDDWLISPDFRGSATKYYRLRYHYKANAYDENLVEVKLSTSGTSPAGFTTTIVPATSYSNSGYVEEIRYFTGVSGTFNIGFHVIGEDGADFSIDNVFIDEMGCPSPNNIAITNVKMNEAIVSWNDVFNATQWEYYVQETGLTAPTNSGTLTTNKQNTMTKDQSGANLLQGTTYDVYVRTICGNGDQGIYEGPYKFTTLCGVNNIPFIESFDSSSLTTQCWLMVDSSNKNNFWTINTSYPYQGDRAVKFEGKSTTGSWLISPTFKMKAANYILKFRYQTGVNASSVPMEVLLSNSGIDIQNFTKTLIASKVYKNKLYTEEVLFFTGTPGDVNIAWNITSDTSVTMNIDNISLEEITTCPEPYNLTITNATPTSFEVSWQQIGGVVDWELIVVGKDEDSSAVPLMTMNITTTPSAIVTGLPSDKLFNVYVRAKCTSSSTSLWSTPAIGLTKIRVNDNCSGAILLPVNDSDQCVSITNGSIYGATESSTAVSGCNANLKKDVWFQFIAKETRHLFSVFDIVSLTGKSNNILGVLYGVDCSQITDVNAIKCFSLSTINGITSFDNLIVGNTYFIRLGAREDDLDLLFKMCISSPRYLVTDDTTHTVEELVKNVLVKTDCDLVSNITSRTGVDFGDGNGIGYFTNLGSDFAFKEGIVLATNNIKYVPGPLTGNQGNDSSNWLGDSDLQDILKMNGQSRENLNASVLEFDFIPIVDSLRFNFIFTSSEYGPSFQCQYSDVFAFLLEDLTTGELLNLAVVPNTSIPVSVTTIRDNKYNRNCGSVNVEYFDKYYGSNGLSTLISSINYEGRTVPMVAKAKVKPGRKYHIKMAIADYGDSSMNSAVFLEAGSFDLGNLDLGADLLVDTGNALCSGEPAEIKSGLSDDATAVTIKWFKDDVLIPGETSPNILVSETGEYKVVGRYNDINCEIEGFVKIEIFPLIKTIVNKHPDVLVCRFTEGSSVVDLTKDEDEMFVKSSRDEYELMYYEDAELEKLIDNPNEYALDLINTTKTIYIYIQNLKSGCFEVFDFKLVATEGEHPIIPSDVIVCGSYELPELLENQFYYSEPGGQGVAYEAGDVLLDGLHTMYILQRNGNGCYEEISYTIKVTAKVTAKVFEDQSLSCKLYELEDLDAYSQYFIEVNGVRIPALAGTLIHQTNTKVYVVAKSEDGICIDESSFVVRYGECPIPKGISPNGDGYNDRFDLSDHGVSSIQIFNRNGSEVYSFSGLYTDQWDGKGKNKKDLPSGTYFYVIQSFDKTRTGWVELSR